MSLEISVSYPAIADATVGATLSTEKSFAFGKTVAKEKTVTFGHEFHVPECTWVKAIVSTSSGKATIPFTATLTYKEGLPKEVKGTWTGQQYSKVHTRFETLRENTCEGSHSL
jgi:hypothetical protein